jgi:hypothetical protein
MNHERILRFRYDETLFEATVTYNDEPFGRVRHDHPIRWNVTLNKPVKMDCGGGCRQISGFSSAMILYSPKGRRQRFVYDDSPDYQPTDDEINIFPQAVRNILYHYYNAEHIEHYASKITALETALDRKYAERLEALRQKRLTLRKRLRAGKIDSKIYQKLSTPIQKAINELDFQISEKKRRFSKRYSDCGRLKKRYRVFDPDLLTEEMIQKMLLSENTPNG